MTTLADEPATESPDAVASYNLKWRGIYVKLLRRAVTGEPLTDAEAIYFSNAIDAAGITDEQLAADRATLEADAAGNATREEAKRLKAAADVAAAEYEEHYRTAKAVLDKHLHLLQAMQTAAEVFTEVEAQVKELDAKRAKRCDLFTDFDGSGDI